jgi:predicted Zn-dependent peptidase
MTRQDLAGYWGRRYGAGSTVLAMAGSIEHEQAVELAGKLLGGWEGPALDHHLLPAEPTPAVRLVHRETEQAHLVIGGIGIDRYDERRFAFDILNHIMGGGMSSRLFIKIREERGLAYAIYSFRLAHADTGAWGVYVGTTPDQADTCLGLIEEEIAALVESGVSDEELERAKGSIRGSLALSMEDPNSRMIRLGRDELAGAPHLSVDDRLARVEAVTVTEVQTVARTILKEGRAMGAVGPFGAGDLDRWIS